MLNNPKIHSCKVYIASAPLSKVRNYSYITYWSNHGSENLYKTLNMAKHYLSQAIVRDMSEPQIKPDSTHPTNVWYDNGTLNNYNYAAYLEDRINNKSILRRSDGQVVIVDNEWVKPKHNWRE